MIKFPNPFTDCSLFHAFLPRIDIALRGFFIYNHNEGFLMRSKQTSPSAEKKKHPWLKLLWLLPGPVFYALFRLSFLFPAFTETVYSRAVFRFINQGLSTATGLLPFSLGEILLYAFILALAFYIVLMAVRAILAKKEWWHVLLRRVIALCCAASMLYALFVGLWGFNYAREPLGGTLGLDTSPATVKELYSTCEALVQRANSLRFDVPENGSGVFKPDRTRDKTMQSTEALYSRAAEQTGNGFLGGSFGRAKPVLYSTGLSWAHITGIYFPFTGESNVNADIPDLLFAATCLHETAHQRGFSREDEANFLAYYVCSFSGDINVMYSGTMLALIHAMNQLHDAGGDRYYALRATYTDGLNRDLAAYSKFWQQYESPVREAAETVNNNFLKANMQDDGVKSYGRMVDLLIGLWRAGGI